MKITDKEVLHMLEKHRLYHLWDMLEDFPEDEVGGHTDLEMFKHELSWLAYRYTNDGLSLHDELKEAQNILRKTKYGKKISWIVVTNGNKIDLKPSYRESDIEWAKDFVNEYKRTMSMTKKLKVDY